ncbi:hypothetical protein [Bacillus infantis]|uniref:hypothetical protein n=1 Tax=Bacillus infantis TaxID=324767 RepID=UPI003CF929DA
MKQERMILLIELYIAANKNGSMHIPVHFTLEDLCCGALDLEYLEDAGYLRIDNETSDPLEDRWDVYITLKGMDAVENNEQIVTKENFNSFMERISEGVILV